MASNGWDEWKRHVLSEIEGNSEAHGKIFEKLEHISIDVAKLKVQAGVWGGIAGLSSAIFILALFVLKQILFK